MADIKRTGGNGRRATAVSHKGMVFTSGITSRMLEDGMRAQTQDVLQQIDALLAQHGTDKLHVLNATVTLADMTQYGEFNAAWDEWVIDGFEPTRSVTEGALAVPEYLVKISVVAVG